MLARFPRRPSLTLVGVVALVLATANPAAAPPGDLDPTFDGDGKVTTDFASNTDSAEAVAIQADGKIVTAGYAFGTATAPDFALARYNADGSLDATFDGDGMVTTDFAGPDEAFAVAIQGDGKIVAAGFADIPSRRDFALARYNSDGSLDATFDGDGRVTTDFGESADVVSALAIQGDGKIVSAGVSRVSAGPGDRDFALARYNSDGSLDATFDGDGKVTTDFASGSEDALSAVAIQGDGRIVAGGCFMCFEATSDFALARYNADGSLDTTFDGDGRATTDFAGADEATGVVIQGDGRIVAGGHAFVAGGTYDFAMARYNGDGSLDATFDGDGTVTTDFAGNHDQAFALAIQTNGKLVAAGCVSCFVFGPTVDFAVARYNVNGFLDTTFSTDGKVTTDFAGEDDQAYAVAIQTNGRIVAAGFAVVETNDFAVARYTCDRRTSRRMSIPLC